MAGKEKPDREDAAGGRGGPRGDGHEGQPEQGEGEKDVVEEAAEGRRAAEEKSFLGHLMTGAGRAGALRSRFSIRAIRSEYAAFQREKKETVRKYLTYETVVGNATASSEFYILLILSCLIATFGLYEDSPAVIIGAMIVAPLMGPILGFSAGVLWGSGKAIATALFTLLKGVAIVLAITIGITFAIPYVSITNEMLARTVPGFADIVIALASGLVGAYAHSNNRISSAIPGVAISVALMPPLCTAGIGIGKLDFAVAEGAALLFAINLVGISLAALVVFYLVKLHPSEEGAGEESEVRRRFMRQIAISIVLLLVISVPLVIFAVRAVSQNNDKLIIARDVGQTYRVDRIYSTDIVPARRAPGDRGAREARAGRRYAVRVILLQEPPAGTMSAEAVTARLEKDTGNMITLDVLYFGHLGSAGTP